MAVDIHDFHKASQSLTERQRQIDVDDLHHEIAGLDAGRNKRFLGGDNNARTQAEQRRRNRDHVQQITALQTLLQNDPEYAALYKASNDLLTKAERLSETALEQAETALLQADESLEGTLEHASRMPDGRKVFKDQHGNARTEDGELVAPDEAESIVWKQDAHSYEDYATRKQQSENARKQVDDIRHYQMDVLGNARERMEDEENPISPAEMKRIQENIITKSPEGIAIRDDAEVSEAPSVQAASHDIEILKF